MKGNGKRVPGIPRFSSSDVRKTIKEIKIFGAGTSIPEITHAIKSASQQSNQPKSRSPPKAQLVPLLYSRNTDKASQWSAGTCHLREAFI